MFEKHNLSRRQKFDNLHLENGVAIVSILIIVAIVAIISTQITVHQQRFINRITHMLDNQRQLLLAFSIEAWAENLLIDDLTQTELNPNHKIDTFNDNWSNELNPSPIGDSTLSGEIIDLQSKINLNNLTHTDNIYIAQMNLLFKKLKIKPILIDALRDYIDIDNQTYSSNSAENSYYTSLDKPYKIANQPMVALSELRLIKGFTQVIIDQLKPWVWVGPKTVNKVNINTASELVLGTLSDKINSTLIAKIVEKQNDIGFLDVNEFIELIGDISVNKKLLTTSSNYFLLESRVDNPRIGQKIQTFLYRDSSKKKIKKIRRIIQ